MQKLLVDNGNVNGKIGNRKRAGSFLPAQRILVIELPVVAADGQRMPQEQLHVSIHTVVDSVHHQVTQTAAEFRADALHGQFLCVDDRVVSANPGQELCHTLCQRTLLILTHEQSNGSIGHQNFLHTMEEFGAGD